VLTMAYRGQIGRFVVTLRHQPLSVADGHQALSIKPLDPAAKSRSGVVARRCRPILPGVDESAPSPSGGQLSAPP
jgi:hypothetical protein